MKLCTVFNGRMRNTKKWMENNNYGKKLHMFQIVDDNKAYETCIEYKWVCMTCVVNLEQTQYRFVAMGIYLLPNHFNGAFSKILIICWIGRFSSNLIASHVWEFRFNYLQKVFVHYSGWHCEFKKSFQHVFCCYA